MSRTVYLHIGAPKTGTTYVQDRLTRNARSLADHGVHFPSRSPFVSPGLSQFRAALDLLGQDWGGAPGHAQGSWDALVKKVRRLDGTVVISHEILAPAPPELAARAVSELGVGAELHLVYSVRDLGRALPAAWQESIKQGRRWPYRRFLRRVRRGTPWFYRAFDVPSVLATWGEFVPPERVHVVTVPPSGAPRGAGDDPLWVRFCTAFGIDPAWAPHDSDRTNRSLGVAETAMLRQLNKKLGRAARREAAFDHLVREMLAQDELLKRESAPVRLPPAARGWVEDTTAQWIDHLAGSDLDLIGDLDDLRPRWPGDDEVWVDPDRVRAKQRLQVALDALAAMTREAASRPDPDRHLPTRLRKNAGRLRSGR